MKRPARKPAAEHRKQVGNKSITEKEVVIEVDWSLGQAAPHVATLTAYSTPLSWKLQAALELTMCELLTCIYIANCEPHQCCYCCSLLVKPRNSTDLSNQSCYLNAIWDPTTPAVLCTLLG